MSSAVAFLSSIQVVNTVRGIPDSLLSHFKNRVSLTIFITIMTMSLRSTRMTTMRRSAARGCPPPLPLPNQDIPLLDSDVSGLILSYLDGW